MNDNGFSSTMAIGQSQGMLYIGLEVVFITIRFKSQGDHYIQVHIILEILWYIDWITKDFI